MIIMKMMYFIQENYKVNRGKNVQGCDATEVEQSYN